MKYHKLTLEQKTIVLNSILNLKMTIRKVFF
jgi:hypothetical protein